MAKEILKLFRNTDFKTHQKALKNVTLDHLINILNFINFQDGKIFINFKHKKYDNVISIPAYPHPCLGNNLHCEWTQESGNPDRLKSYDFESFHIIDGEKIVIINADLKKIDDEGVNLHLPKTCYEFNSRNVVRHSCLKINTLITQDGLIFEGSLFEFSGTSFCVEISNHSALASKWLNMEFPVNIIFKKDQDILYSGECKIIRDEAIKEKRFIVLEPLFSQIRRFKSKAFRSPRQRLVPSPNILFTHPFTQKSINLEIDDISGSGLSVTEFRFSSVLLTGMIIPDVTIESADSSSVHCSVQVVYRNFIDDNLVKCGLAFLDMDGPDHVRLSALLHKVANRNFYICKKVNLDELMKFFFETGFVYPQKYSYIHTNKAQFKVTYKKLYLDNPEIARHFVYQEKGKIEGHMSMVRFYENTWLIHHHAARATSFKGAGIIVLEQIGQFINEAHSLYSSHMSFISCYYRPDNKFPNQLFGGVTKKIDDPKGSEHHY